MIGHDRVVVASTDISCVHFFASRDEQSHVVMGGKDQYNFRAARRKQVRVHTCVYQAGACSHLHLIYNKLTLHERVGKLAGWAVADSGGYGIN